MLLTHLLGTQDSIARLRGRAHPFREAELIVTYHPAYLLRNPEDKRKVMEDMILVRQRLEQTAGIDLPPPLRGRR